MTRLSRLITCTFQNLRRGAVMACVALHPRAKLLGTVLAAAD